MDVASWFLTGKSRSPVSTRFVIFRVPGFQLVRPPMSVSIDGEAPHPAQDYSASQLLHAAKTKLQVSTFGGRFVWGERMDMLSGVLKPENPAGSRRP